MLNISMSRRALLLAGTAGSITALSNSWLWRDAKASSEWQLAAQLGRVPMVGSSYPNTSVWGYNGRVPGPEIRVKQGTQLRVAVTNELAEETTVHWHGIRLPNAMDGVPHLTQKPISPGATFTYEFVVPDAGTYWYHPHQRSFEQVGRGLYGPLIIEESAPLAVDRDVVWILDDWRLTREAEISDDFGGFHDMSHNGRVGNTVTVNGRIQETFAVRAGERIRLRLINAANARIFGLEFRGHQPQIIALDGQPVEPHEPEDGRIVLGPAMRIDLLLDFSHTPDRRFPVVDSFYKGLEYRLLDLVYSGAPPIRSQPSAEPLRLIPNPLLEPDLVTVERHEIIFNGGMMSGMMGGGGMMRGMMGGDMRGMMHDSKIWTINGIAATGHVMEPLLTLTKGRTYLLDMHNDTAWHHPIHLHGHSFRVLTRNGNPTRYREWQDTVLMAPRERVEIAFVADNPGDWMFHCHILEHQVSGMMGVIRVA